MVKANWNQNDPFNKFSPDFGDGKKHPVGCVPTAAAQIMRYYEWPPCAHGSGGYYYKEHSNYTSKDLSGKAYDWSNMLYEYGRTLNGYFPYSELEADAVALLMSDCQLGANVIFGLSSGTGATATNMMRSFVNNFDYSENIFHVSRNLFTAEEWQQLVYNNLNNIGPVLYGGTGPQDAHAYIVDGYDGDGFYHVNWGWAFGDWYCTLDALNVRDISFTYGQHIVGGIQPINNDTEIYRIVTGTYLEFPEKLSKDVYMNFDLEVSTCNMRQCNGCIGLSVEDLEGKVINIFDESTLSTFDYDVFSPKIDLSQIDNGIYTVRPICKEIETGDVLDIHFDLESSPYKYKMTVTDSDIRFEPIYYSEGKLAETLSFFEDFYTIEIDESYKLETSNIPDDVNDKTIYWKSFNPDIVSVDDEGNIKGISAGETTITASCGHATAIAYVNVIKRSQEIIWDQDIAELKVGDIVELSAKSSADLSIMYYCVEGGDCIFIEDNKLTALKSGYVLLYAIQSGNDKYDSAHICKEINIVKKDQTILWNQEFMDIYVGDVIDLNAVASSGLAVSYKVIKGSDLAEIVDNKLKTLKSGEVLIEAYQDGDDMYNASPKITKTFIIEKLDQTLEWNQEIPNLSIGDKVEFNAQLSSFRPVSYIIEEGADLLEYDERYFQYKALKSGQVTVTAYNDGDEIYNVSNRITKSFLIKYEQALIWDQELDDLHVGDEIQLTAYSTSGLEVSYKYLQDTQEMLIDGSMLKLEKEGVITVIAFQNGDDMYEKASPVSKMINVLASNIDALIDDYHIECVNNALIIKGLSEDRIIEIYDVLGRMVYIGANQGVNLSPGLYLIKFGSYTVKFNIK